ncbi:MAG: squalene synthase HpnC [Zetaproteobacteria bacterium CG1_02_53_45]|nr:MAG: squalene synthase HpnC [Zetaproteobacteria bacterium CG1_02_53_45]
MQASTGQPMQLAQAYQHCLDIARNHYENFPTASKLLSARLRPAVAAIYAFARHADDLADEGDALPATRLKQLDAWETLLERCENDASINHPVFLALGDAIRTFNLDVDELDNLLIAFRMDVTLHGYATLEELLFYCRHSANPVGRLMLMLHRVNSSQAYYCSDKICSALQLINFWQDLSVDLPRGRCYLPECWLQEAGLSGQQLLGGDIDAQALQPVLHKAIAQTRSMLEEGVPLLAMIPLRLRLQIAATIHGGRLMLKKIETAEQPLKERTTLSKSEWKKLLLPVLKDTLFPPKAGKS